MSDIFERLQPTNLFTVDREGTQQRRAENNDFWDRQNQEQQEVNQQRQKNLDRYTVHLSDDQYEILNLAIANAEVPEDEAYNMAAALKLAEKYDLPLADARRNLERYRDAIFGTGKRYTPKDSFTAIADNWQIGVNTMSLGKLGNELSVAHEEGDAERAAALWEKIQQLKQETDSLADYQDRNVVIEALKFGAQSVPFTGAVAGTAIVGNLLAPGVGSIAAFSTSVALTRGQEYIDLLEAGANPEIARRVATASGVIQAGVEMALGNVASAAGGAVKLLGKKAIGPGSPAQALAEKLTADILKKLHWSGTFRRAAIRLGTGYAFEALEEGTEEVIQELASVASLQAAASLQGEGVTTKTAREVGEAVGESFRGGLMGSLVLGIPGTIFNTGATVRDARKVMAAAETTPSREAFKKDTAGSRLFEGMSDERREAAQDELYNKAQQRRDREEARLTEEIKARGSQLEGLQERKLNKEGEDVTPGVYRNRDGSLYARIEDEKRENGVITGSFRMGDASRTTESNTYGAIDYRIDGGALTITGFHVADHRRDLTDEFYQQFAKKFADNTIQWDPESEADIALKEHLATQNRRGPEAALNYFEPEAVRGEALEIQQLKQNVDRQLAQALPRSTPESRQGVVSLLDRIGRGYGLDFDAFLDRLGFDRENIFTNTPNQEVTEFNERAAQYAKDPDRAKARGALFKTLKQLDSDVKAVEYTVVYLDPEAADFSTVVHELKHAVDNFLEQADPELYRRMMDAAGAYDAKSGMDETTWRKERSAYAWENYLQTGQAPTPELRNLFRQMVEWLKDIVGNLSGMRKLTPEQKAAFDELLSKADAFEQEESGSPGNAAEINKDSPHNLVDVVDGGQDTASTPEGPQEASLTPPEGVSEGAGREDPEQRKRENQQILKDPAAGPAAKVAAALDDAGIAKAEVEGALFQTREDRIAALESSPDIVLDGNAYQGKYELNKESILDYLNNTLKKVTMYNPAIKEKIRLGGTGIDKLIGWGMNNEVYKKLFAHIPEITEKSIFIADEKPN
ncbi:MAG: hypothetical protein LBU16_09890, partial [Treponema sp.]|nr:hypothetical protein [Treponema sp.]